MTDDNKKRKSSNKFAEKNEWESCGNHFPFLFKERILFQRIGNSKISRQNLTLKMQLPRMKF